MSDGTLHARLVNAGGELIAEGLCRVDEPAGVATLEPAREPGSIQKERSALVLQLESGRSLRVNGRPLVMRVHPPDRAGGRNGHGPDTHGARTFYRLRIMAQPEAIERAQDVAAAGAQDEGPSALPEWGASAAR